MLFILSSAVLPVEIVIERRVRMLSSPACSHDASMLRNRIGFSRDKHSSKEAEGRGFR